MIKRPIFFNFIIESTVFIERRLQIWVNKCLQTFVFKLPMRCLIILIFGAFGLFTFIKDTFYQID